jgi:pimeloyl-ACP methyl ester carboxylesterase
MSLGINIKNSCLKHLIEQRGIPTMAAKKLVANYSQILSVKNKKISVNIAGHGKKVIILLPGSGIASPILDMKPLFDLLKKNYTVVIIEPLGYGFSDDPDSERTTQHIVEEWHDIIAHLGYKKYSLMPHSYSSLHALNYSNAYPNEVEAVVSLDGGPPFLIDTNMHKKMQATLKVWEDPDFVEISFKENIKNLEKFLTSQEIALYQEITLFRITHLLTAEQSLAHHNYNNPAYLTFPSYIPVLILMSSELKKLHPNLESLHHDTIKHGQNSKIYTLEGSHMVYYEHSHPILQLFEAFIKP